MTRRIKYVYVYTRNYREFLFVSLGNNVNFREQCYE